MTGRPFQSLGGTMRPYHLRDDFGDSRLTEREGATTHQHPEPYEFTGAGRMLAAQYRPEWVVVDSGPAGQNQRFTHDCGDSGDGQALTASELQVGRWRWRFEWVERDDSGAPDVVDVDLMTAHPREAPRWSVRVDSEGNVSLRRSDGGSSATTAVSTTIRNPDDPFTVEVARSPWNEWRLRINGISRGTTTDSFLPEPGVLAIDIDANGDSVVAIDDLEVR